MTIVVNGTARELATAATVTAVLTLLEAPETGCAVAVNAVVVPRAEWPQHILHDGDLIDVLTAVPGG
ncbi:MAG TPA: sulfur carrier protein ThiS [Mycobacteriales bacterium]|nr:sulfur carrier protein ThiS [Mycobacteriales bacterium]